MQLRARPGRVDGDTVVVLHRLGRCTLYIVQCRPSLAGSVTQNTRLSQALAGTGSKRVYKLHKFQTVEAELAQLVR